jgi:hypothetical protein
MSSGTVLQGGRRYPLMTDVVWMPGGDRLLVVRPDESPMSTNTSRSASLWEVPLSGAPPRKLGLLPPSKLAGPAVGSFSVHPDGKLLAFHFHEGLVQQTWAIDNLAQFIKAGGGW